MVPDECYSKRTGNCTKFDLGLFPKTSQATLAGIGECLDGVRVEWEFLLGWKFNCLIYVSDYCELGAGEFI